MKKSTKGALAAGAAGVLLLGGAGSLAYWTGNGTVDAGTLSSGSITLGTVDCGDGWVHTETSVAVGTVVPGDTIQMVCEVYLTLVGDHIGATLDIDDVTATGPLATALDFDPVTLTGATVTGNAVSGAGAHAVTATISAEFPYGTVSTPDPLTGADNTTQGITVEDLGELSLVAVQVHK